MEQRVLARLGTHFQVEKIGMMLPSQDKEFVGHRIPKTGRQLKSVKTRPLMSWRKSQWNETRRKTSIVLLRCTQCTEAYWDKQIGYKVGHRSNVATKCPDVCASMAASPTIGDVKSLNQFSRQIKSQPLKLQYWPLFGPLRILGFPYASYRNNDVGSSLRGMTVFLAESRERSSKDGMAYGSLIDYESSKIKKTMLSTTVAELYSFMKCFGSCQFLRGLWMDIPGEVTTIHMRTDAKNLVTTARTIHLPEQKETIHMISMLRKEACAGSIRDLAHIPTPNCLAHCLTKASAKADILITAVKTGRLLEVDTHPDFGTLMEHKAFLSTWCKTFLHTREKEVFFLNTLKISLGQTPQEGPFQVRFVGTQHTKERKKLNSRKCKGQDARKITSAPAESCIQFPWAVMPILMTTLTWMVRKNSQPKHHRGVHRGDR